MNDPDRLEWEPHQAAHSIELVATALNFSEPLNDVAWKRVVRDSEGPARAAGLSEKANLQGFEITIGLPQQTAPAPLVGVQFLRTTAVDSPAGSVQRKLQEAVLINKSGLIFQSAVYSRWEAYSSRIQLLLRPALRTALHSVGVANIRLEYKDSFRHLGDGKPLARTLLNPDSRLIAPHVFDNEQLWHSHTGFFESAPNCKERLIQVNIDSNFGFDISRPQEQFRMVAITTGVQNNFDVSQSQPIENEEELANFYLAMVESLHGRAIEVFKNLVSSAIAVRIGLQ